MLKQVFYITLNYLTTTFRSWSTLLFALLMPLVFTLVLGSVMSSQAVASQPQWSLGVVDEDGVALSRGLVTKLAATPGLHVETLGRGAALTQVRQGSLMAALVIPAGFSTAVSQGRPPALALTIDGSQVPTAQSVEMAVRAALSRLYAIARTAQIAVDATSAAGQPVGYAQALAAAQVLWAGPRPVNVAVQAAAPIEAPAAALQSIPDGFDQSSPGMLVTFGLAFMLSGATVLVSEREEGTLRRLLVLPLRRAGILSGKLGGIWTAGLAQAALLIVAGALVFHVNWGQSPAALAVMVLAFGFSIAGLGMMIAALARTYAQANALTNILLYSVAAIGGAWWPIEVTPAWMQQVARALPSYWAMQGFQDIITRGRGLPAVMPNVLALVGFGIVFLTIGTWRFRFE
jgi:ABC-2 type transport system permease protein